MAMFIFWITILTATAIIFTASCRAEKKNRIDILTKFKNKTLTTSEMADLPKETLEALDKLERMETLSNIVRISESENRLGKRSNEEHENTLKYVDEELTKMRCEDE